jgi:F0F1-type ATP synthase assembly protein I
MTESELKIATARRMEEERLLAAARPPQSELSKKTDNFLYHNKWLVAGMAFLLIFGMFLIRDLLFRTKPDFLIITVGIGSIHPDNHEWMEYELSRILSESRDKDGIISLDTIRLPTYHVPERLRAGWEHDPDDIFAGAHAEMELGGLVKLTALLTAAQDPIFLLDTASFVYHARMAVGISSFDGTDEDFINWIPDETEFFYPLHAGGENIYALPLELLDLPPELALIYEGYSLYLRDTRHNARGAEAFNLALEFLSGFVLS